MDRRTGAASIVSGTGSNGPALWEAGTGEGVTVPTPLRPTPSGSGHQRKVRDSDLKRCD